MERIAIPLSFQAVPTAEKSTKIEQTTPAVNSQINGESVQIQAETAQKTVQELSKQPLVNDKSAQERKKREKAGKNRSKVVAPQQPHHNEGKSHGRFIDFSV